MTLVEGYIAPNAFLSVYLTSSAQHPDISQWKKNVQDIGGEVLCVSQFTLLASTKKGNKPSFHQALAPDEARRLYQHFVNKVQEGYVADRVKDGVFQAMMEVALVNDGPVCSPILAARCLLTITLLKVTLEVTAGKQQEPEKPTGRGVAE